MDGNTPQPAATDTSAVESVDCVVIGAGVVGLACARALAQAGQEVLILEAAPTFGTGVSSRNSEVIHAGLYYPTHSLKARLCVRGRALLYAYCQARQIPHQACGKLIVATRSSQLTALQVLEQQALANGVTDVRPLSQTEALKLEPALNCVAALHSPSTGIVDSHSLMLSLLGDAEQAGAQLIPRTPVLGGELTRDGLIMLSMAGDQAMRLRARKVINASGLMAPMLARRLPRLSAAQIPAAHLAKGHYFALQGRAPFSRLIYPLPEPGGLGVHLTLDLQGRARFGPDVQWLPSPGPDASFESMQMLDYTVDADRLGRFADEIRQYWPALENHQLNPDYAGIRPKISAQGEATRDFVIETAQHHGVPGLINLLGIESPGLTSCLAIGEYVANALSHP